MTCSELVRRFEDGSIPAGDFHHREHVQLTFAYLDRLPAVEALERLSSGLRDFATRHGAPEKYNETITWAYFFLIRARRAASRGAAWDEFERLNPDLFDWQASPLGRYYRPETLASDAARRTFQLPDAGVT